MVGHFVPDTAARARVLISGLRGIWAAGYLGCGVSGLRSIWAVGLPACAGLPECLSRVIWLSRVICRGFTA